MNRIEATSGIRMMRRSQPLTEGAGVHLKRAFGYYEAPAFDPFLMLDDFRSNNPRDYVKGFPFHPHRGIETITYILHGSLEHEDNMGNQGVIESGGLEWMTAGSGIIHQEMPKGDAEGRMGGFQLWSNLPADRKMMEPRYREVKCTEIPEITMNNGIWIRVICGEIAGERGPVRDIVTDPEYLDVTVPPEKEFTHPTKPGHTVFAYVIEGRGRFGRETSELAENQPAANETLILFDEGERISVSTGAEPVRFLLVSGKPIGEHIAWRGSVVMNTERELETAFEELRNGTFIKHGKAG